MFQKMQKTLFWGHGDISAFFAQIWANINFPGRKPQSVFKYSNYLPSCQKSEKELTDGWIDRRKDGQTTMILLASMQDEGPMIKVTLSFPEFISKHQKQVYFINFFVRNSQFQISATTVVTPIYEHSHPNVFQSTFNFSEFVSTCKKSDFFIILFQRYS